MTGLRACLWAQEARASLQLVLSTRTPGGWIGEFRTIATPASHRSVFAPKISIHSRMSTTEPHGGSRNQVRCVQLLRALQPASQSIVSCVQAKPHFYTENMRWGGEDALRSQQENNRPTWMSRAWVSTSSRGSSSLSKAARLGGTLGTTPSLFVKAQE